MSNVYKKLEALLELSDHHQSLSPGSVGYPNSAPGNEMKRGPLNGLEIYAGNIKNDEKWHQKWWGKLLLTIFAGLIIAFFVYQLAWN